MFLHSLFSESCLLSIGKLSLSIYFDQKTGKEHVDIITFYNEIFIPAVKPLLVELGPGGSGTTIRTNRVPEVNNNNDGMLVS